MRAARVIFLALAAATAPVTAAAQTAPAAPATRPATQTGVPPLSDAAMLKLTELDARIAQVRDMTTRFRQEKHTPLTKRPMVSTGTIRVKGSVTLWETEKPAPSFMRIDEKELQVFYPREKTLEIYRLDQQMAKMAASPLPRLALLRRTFDIGEDINKFGDSRYLCLQLAPKEASLREHVSHIFVTLDLEQGHMKQMTMLDPDGERTELSFEDVRMNRGLTDADLQLKLPADVKIVRPLEALEAGQAP